MQRILMLLLCLGLPACAKYSYTNSPLKATEVVEATPASLDLSRERLRRDNNHEVLMVLALSGGGSRAAYLAAAAMFRLQKAFADQGVDLLKQVDLISAVSGGALPAAYYLISADPGNEATVPSNRTWDENQVKSLMSRNYLRPWFGSWFLPANIARFWFTDYDRSDIMAKTFADILFDVNAGGANILNAGRDLVFADANPARPNVVLNATIGTREGFGDVFRFADEDFGRLRSDIRKYDISRAVMASASFPAVFNYMTLANFSSGDTPSSFEHVFDGGNRDNLGLETIIEVIGRNDGQNGRAPYRSIIVILVDAYTGTKGIPNLESDGRRSLSYFVDLNFLDSLDSLLRANRETKVVEMRHYLNDELGVGRRTRSTFWHINFDAIEDAALRDNLRSIPTNFKIDPEHTAWLDQAIDALMPADSPCLAMIRDLLGPTPTAIPPRNQDPCW